MRPIVFLFVCSLGVAWSTKSGEGITLLGAGHLDPAAPENTGSTPGTARDKRHAAPSPVAARWYSMLRAMAGDATGAEDWRDTPQPFWLPLRLSSGNGAARDRSVSGEVPVLVVPVPVSVATPGAGALTEDPEKVYVSSKVTDGWMHESIGSEQAGGSGAAGSVNIGSPSRVETPTPGRQQWAPPVQPEYDEEELFEPEPPASSRDLIKQYREQIEGIPDEYKDEWTVEPEGWTDKAQAQTVELERPTRTVVRRRRVRRAVNATAKNPASAAAANPAQSPPTEPLLQQPPRPTFEGPMALSGSLYVRTAQYSEPFNVWRDKSGGVRLELHGGATVALRVPLPNGQMQLQLMEVDRSGGREVRRCAATNPLPMDATLRRLPVMPDVSLLSFAGYARRGEERAEVWRGVEVGAAGEAGAAPGEALTETHELLVRRTSDGTTPLQYRVTVDSSVLGARSDEHVVRYEPAARAQPSSWELDSARCDVAEQLDPNVPDQLARLEPLREFTARGRDPRYTALANKFTLENSRKYLDREEEAVRKTLLMQNSRFVTSGNRAGQPFALGVNFLSDRLDVDRARLQGVRSDISSDAALPFPYSRQELACLAAQLPPAFDWREHGGVTPVRFQGLKCASCWAFAVTGAVEGALFIKTKQLQQLSEQCLVDCSKTYGGRGCGGTWPEHAYEYVSARGLPATDYYRPYNATALKCSAEVRTTPETRIAGFTTVPPNDIDAIKVAIRLHAPVVVLMDVKSSYFTNYKTGVMNATNCQKTRKFLKHAMLAVGWDNENGKTNLIVKNTWSKKWGADGYVRVQADGNTCGVLTLSSLPILDDRDRHQEFASCYRSK